MSSILEQIKKYGRTDYTPSSSSAPPKKSWSSKADSPVQTLPPLSLSELEDLAEKSSARQLPAPSRIHSKATLQGLTSELLSSFKNDFDKFVKQKFIAEQNDRHALELYKTIQQCIYQLSTVSTLYKSKVGNYDKKLMAENQNLKKELEKENEQSTKLGAMIKKLEEKAALSESTSSQLKREL